MEEDKINMKNQHECSLFQTFSDKCEMIEIYPPISLENRGYAVDKEGALLEDKTKPKIKVRHCDECRVVLL